MDKVKLTKYAVKGMIYISVGTVVAGNMHANRRVSRHPLLDSVYLISTMVSSYVVSDIVSEKLMEHAEVLVDMRAEQIQTLHSKLSAYVEQAKKDSDAIKK